ncbi:hypothetical protein FNV43_RR10272 [Rhamnella rubrinervis]|uniref:SWIM-type domain-containing protein n=1 Tax=Rhamnella rubrinervis TaxID=2594499 RepID=A0A8K0MKZ6_9ROSA|nr:hypothetical protein FNV43_RR10272 [Rhamnella rubrinervis]
MEFQSIEEAFTFYNTYARECGFSARMSNSKKNKETNELVWKQFVCSKEGKTDDSYGTKLKDSIPRTYETNRGVVRSSYKAKITLVKQQTGPNWVVSKFVKEHNHSLSTPTKVDEVNRPVRCFWVDPIARRAYASFGDVAVFDTAYNTNKYDNEWLGELYAIHGKWIPAYVNKFFSAGMSSNQRAKSAHSFFKKYISKRNSLMGFINHFNKALSHQRHEKLVADYIDLNEKPKLKSLWAMEKQMMKVYTERNFILFQKEIFESTTYTINSTYEDDETIVYSVQRHNEQNSARRCRKVNFNKQSDVVSCSCRRFEFKGIRCRHMSLTDCNIIDSESSTDDELASQAVWAERHSMFEASYAHQALTKRITYREVRAAHQALTSYVSHGMNDINVKQEHDDDDDDDDDDKDKLVSCNFDGGPDLTTNGKSKLDRPLFLAISMEAMWAGKGAMAGEEVEATRVGKGRG